MYLTSALFNIFPLIKHVPPINKNYYSLKWPLSLVWEFQITNNTEGNLGVSHDSPFLCKDSKLPKTCYCCTVFGTNVTFTKQPFSENKFSPFSFNSITVSYQSLKLFEEYSHTHDEATFIGRYHDWGEGRFHAFTCWW
jgi:hypothetical protein